MSGLWIRVDVSTPRDPRVAAFARAIHRDIPTAYGHLCMVWGAMAEHTPTGECPDSSRQALEEWAAWKGRRGVLRDAFVEIFVVDGYVRGYAERQGALVDRMARDRLRHSRKFRGSSAESRRDSASTVRNETERNERPTELTASSTPNGAVPGTAVVRRRASAPMPALDLVLAKTQERTDRQEYRRALAGFVFAYWAQKTGHPNARADDKRIRRITARLEESRDNVRELLYAVDGALRDPWLMGQDRESTKRYDGIDTLLRDRAQVERLAELMSAYKADRPHPVEAQIPGLEGRCPSGPP